MLPVSKHHDGFCMWNATSSPGWNAADIGPKRDVLTELYDAVTAPGSNLSFAIYYSQGEWFDSDMVKDSKSNFTQTKFLEKVCGLGLLFAVAAVVVVVVVVVVVLALALVSRPTAAAASS